MRMISTRDRLLQAKPVERAAAGRAKAVGHKTFYGAKDVQAMYAVLYWGVVTLLAAWIIFVVFEMIRGF